MWALNQPRCVLPLCDIQTHMSYSLNLSQQRFLKKLMVLLHIITSGFNDFLVLSSPPPNIYYLLGNQRPKRSFCCPYTIICWGNFGGKQLKHRYPEISDWSSNKIQSSILFWFNYYTYDNQRLEHFAFFINFPFLIYPVNQILESWIYL